MANLWFIVILGINIPFELSEISNAAEGCGVLVPIPIFCPKEFNENIKGVMSTKSRFIITIFSKLINKLLIMDPPQINYLHNNCLLVVNPQENMRQLFTPIKVQVL